MQNLNPTAIYFREKYIQVCKEFGIKPFDIEFIQCHCRHCRNPLEFNLHHTLFKLIGFEESAFPEIDVFIKNGQLAINPEGFDEEFAPREIKAVVMILHNIGDKDSILELLHGDVLLLHGIVELRLTGEDLQSNINLRNLWENFMQKRSRRN